MSAKYVYNIGNETVIDKLEGGAIIINSSPNSHMEIDYDKIVRLLQKVSSYEREPGFNEVFGGNERFAKEVINYTIEVSQKKEQPQLVRKNIDVLNDLIAGTSCSLIASGIVELVKMLLNCT